MPLHVSLDILWVEDQALGRRDAGESEVNDWIDEHSAVYMMVETGSLARDFSRCVMQMDL